MSAHHSKRIVVWVQHFADRPYLMLQWHDPTTGKRKSKSAETCNPVDAERKRADLESDLNHGRYVEPALITWEGFRERFEDEYVAGGRPRTRRNYRNALDLFERLAGPKSLRSVSAQTLSAFVAAMRKEPCRGRVGMAPSSMAVYLQYLRTALRWAAGQKLIPECPRFPRVKAPERHPRPIPAESFERILARAEDAPTRAYLLCGWLAGLRLSEAFELEWQEAEDAPYVDLARNRVVLPATFAKAARDQWVPLDPRLREALLALPRHGRKVFRFLGPDGRPIRAESMSVRVVRLARRAGVRLTMHSLRKGFGCRYAGKVPAQVLQKLMRHRSIKTTMDYYANVDAAVEAAVLGDAAGAQEGAQRNSSRNKPEEGRADTQGPGGATLDGEGQSAAS
jgi:integrase